MKETLPFQWEMETTIITLFFTSTSLIKLFPVFYGIFVLNPQATSNGYPYYHSTGAAWTHVCEWIN